MLERTAKVNCYRFDQLANQVNDRVMPADSDVERYVGLEHLDSDSLQIRRWGDPSEVESTKLRFQPGDIILGKRRVYQRKVALADTEGICSAHAMVLRAKPAVVKPEFLPFFMQSDVFMERALRISVGSLSPTINWKTLAKEEFLIPSIQEQTSVLSVLQTAESTCQSLRNLQAAMRTAITSLLDSVFDPVATREMMKSRLKSLPVEWTTLGSIASLQVGFPFKSKGYSVTGDRLLRGSNVAVDSTSWVAEETRYWPTELREEYSDYILGEDDIVIAMDRPFITAGFKVARLTGNDLPALLLQRVGRFLTEDQRTRDLVWACMHSRAFQYQMLSQQEGTDLPHISKAQIEGVLVHRDALGLSDEISRFTKAWRQSVSLGRRVEQALEMKRNLIKAVVA